MEWLLQIGASGATGALVAWALNMWLTARLRADFDKKLEQFRFQIRMTELSEKAKWETKHEACLEALRLVDAVYSHLLSNGDPNVVPQEVSTVAVRDCHNKLLLSCDDPKVISLFLANIGLGGPERAIEESLVELRNAIRRELGFGSPLPNDPKYMWLGYVMGDATGPRPAGAV